jgi:hypothetical protein
MAHIRQYAEQVAVQQRIYSLQHDLSSLRGFPGDFLGDFPVSTGSCFGGTPMEWSTIAPCTEQSSVKIIFANENRAFPAAAERGTALQSLQKNEGRRLSFEPDPCRPLHGKGMRGRLRPPLDWEETAG